MPDARLQRTRDAYRDEWWPRQTVVCTSRPDELLILTGGAGYLYRASDVHQLWPPFAEPSDDDLWGV